jgi:hypothetical protein
MVDPILDRDYTGIDQYILFFSWGVLAIITNNSRLVKTQDSRYNALAHCQTDTQLTSYIDHTLC